MNLYKPIKENRDFRKIYAKGRSFVHPLLVTYIIKSRGTDVRVGITTSKKTGNAVKRNRSRRLIRESFRALGPRVKPGYDFVFVARSKTSFVKSQDVLRVMERQLKNAGAIK